MSAVQLARDSRGTTVVEFALVAPVLLLLSLGGLELAHMMYVRSILQGQTQKAGRDMSLEDAADAVRQEQIEGQVRSAVLAVVSSGSVTFAKTSFHDYRNAHDRMEEYSDSNHNGRCDSGEAFVDANNNSTWDTDTGVDGRGGAKDVVLLTATATYPRLALGKLFASDPDVKLTASTVLRNQPSDEQAAAPMRTCA